MLINPDRWTIVSVLAVSCALAAPVPRHMLKIDGALTESSPRPAREIADQFTAAQMDAPGLYLAKEYKTSHNGVTHLVYRQRFQGLDVHNAEWRVNIDGDGRVLNAGGNLYQAPTGRPADSTRLAAAARAAFAAVNPVMARESTVSRAGMTAKGEARFAAGRNGEMAARGVWYPINGVLQPAWNIVVTDADGISLYDTVIDSGSEAVLSKEALTMFQSAPRGSIYTGISPQPPVKFGVQSSVEPPYVQRVVVPFTGPGSPRGWVTGTETAGNNTITGLNPFGLGFITNPTTAKSPARDFQFPLELGPNATVSTNYSDAVTANLFYWVNRAHDLFYEIGFDEAAGNYQMENFSGAGGGGDPMLAYAQYGIQTPNGFAALNNAFFSVRDRADGSTAMIAMYLTSFNGIWADGSLASDVIIHEYAHGVTSRLIPTMNAGFQGAAMNEALSDFWSLEFLVPEGSAPDGVYPVGEYWSRNFGVGIRSRPYTTNMEINPLTYADLGRVAFSPATHEDGGIWMEALWEIRANLIRQFGETEGRRRLRRIVIDGMKMSPPAPSMVDLRDAILLAERVDYKGESQSQLWEAFARRGLGVLAHSPHSASIQVSASFDKPSNTGVIGFQTETPFLDEPLRITVYDGNYTSETMAIDVTSSSGDLERVILTREGSAFSGLLSLFTGVRAVKNNGFLSMIHGDALTAYYNDQNTGNGAKLVEKTVTVSNNYSYDISSSPPPFTFPNETAAFLNFGPRTTFLPLTLPFDFPFYGKKYREIRVLPEGYIQLDTSLPLPCMDPGSFAGVTGIAPMAMWMRTDGFAQRNEDVFLSRGPNTYTIRWAGETIPRANFPPFTPAPEPVNFAVTLHENGTIQFTYGPGNQNLVSSPPIAGCVSSPPIVGLSRGIGNSPYLPSIGFNRVTFKDAPQMTFAPPFENATVPIVRLDSPAEGATAAGTLNVRGIAYDTDIYLAEVVVLIDGVHQGAAVEGQRRADVCATQQLPGCPFIGFALNIDLKAAGVGPGQHTFQIRAVNAKGGITNYPETPLTFNVEEGDGALPVGVIEGVTSGDTLRGNVLLLGYAYSQAARVTAIDIVVDDITYTRASYGLRRADICDNTAAGAPNCPGIGFFAQLNTASVSTGLPTLRSGEHLLRLRITEENGRVSYQPAEPIRFNIDNATNAAPMGFVTEPTNLQRVSGTLTINGHAWDPDGRITNAVLLVDGVQDSALRYGVPRPEVCATLADVAACPNIGFTGTVDTRRFSNGNHRLGVLLRDNAGRVVVIPAVNAAGMNIVVANP